MNTASAEKPSNVGSSIVRKIDLFIRGSIMPIAASIELEKSYLPECFSFECTEEDTLHNMLQIVKCECHSLLDRKSYFIEKTAHAYDVYVGSENEAGPQNNHPRHPSKQL